MPGENDTKSGELPCRAKSALQTLFFDTRTFISTHWLTRGEGDWKNMIDLIMVRMVKRCVWVSMGLSDHIL